MSRISELDAYGAVDLANDEIEVRDDSDTSMAATGTNKRAPLGQLLVAGNIAVTPSGEITATDQEAVNEEFDARLSALGSIDDMQTMVRIREEFYGIGTVTDGVGTYRWQITTSGAGAGYTNLLFGLWGLAGIGTGTTATGRTVMRLGITQFEGSPLFAAEWRAKLGQLNNAGVDEFTEYLGLHDSNGSADATDGFYFFYSPADTTWHVKTADAGTRTDTDTNVVADTSHHRFRTTSDGAGTARFYIDGTLVATHTTNLPDTGDEWAPALAIAKSVGTTSYTTSADYFAMDLEVPGGR